MASVNLSAPNIGLGTILFVVFLILKLTDKIDWSWFWVCSPLIIGAGLTVFLMCSFIIIAALAAKFSD